MKLDRLLSITLMLVNNDIVTAKELAGKFEVSIRTIYRDIDILGAAGIPIISYQGINGGFGIMEGFKIEKGLLNTQDIDSLTAILKGLSTIFDDKNYDDTLNKLHVVSSNKNKSNLIIDLNTKGWGYYDAVKKNINSIRKAINSNKIITFTYTYSSGEKMSRNVEPLTLALKHNNWYFYAFCRNTNEYSTFKVSRIRDLVITDETCKVDREKKEELNFDGEAKKEIDYIFLELKFSPGVSAIAMDIFSGGDVSYSEDGSMIVKGHFPEVEGLYHRILSFGKELEVVNPPGVRNIIKQKAKEIFELY